MAKTKRKWLLLDWNDPDSLCSHHIQYNENNTITDKIVNISDDLTTLSTSATYLDQNKIDKNDPIFINPIKIINGSYNNPSIQFSNDTDTGIYRPGSNQLGITTGGIARVIVNSVKTEILNELQPKAGVNLPENQYIKYNNEPISANNLLYDQNTTIKEKIDNNKYQYINTNTLLTSNTKYIIDTRTNSIDLTLPLNPSTGDFIYLKDIGNGSINNIILYRNGQKINNTEDDLIINVDYVHVMIIYVDNVGWVT